MADGVVVSTNIRDFRTQLSALGARFESRAVRAGVAAAAGVYVKAARRLAPRLKQSGQTGRKRRVPGALARAIRVIRSKKSRMPAGSVGAFVGFAPRRGQMGTERDAFYGRFLELGWYARGPGRKLRGGVRKRALDRARSATAGARKYRYPFLEPAFRVAGAAALDAFNARVEREIAKENAKRGLG